MKNLLKLYSLASILAFLSACNNQKKEMQVSMEAETEVVTPEWEVLFDGSNFDHWRGYNKDTMANGWTIEGDAMAFTPGEEGGNNIISKEKYTNFILSLEWKISEGGNSGIFYGVHEDTLYSEAYQTGPEIQVLDDDRNPDAKMGAGTHVAGSLYDMIAPSQNVVHPAGEWNSCVLEVNHQTNSGSVALNGVKIAKFPVNGVAWDAMVAKSKFKDWEGFGIYPTGHIGLQDHGSKVWYRNIMIKDLDQ